MMDSATVSADTQAVLLLCGHFSPKEAASPLELREYNRLADWMRAQGIRPSNLLAGDPFTAVDWAEVKLDRDRVGRLLQRGGALALAVEKWAGAGLWVVSCEDDAYPGRLRSHLGRSAPALLFGAGDAATLDRGGLAIVGSRDIDADGEAYAADVARQCARENIQVISGGARGVDEIALSAALEAGGRAVAALAEGLGKASLAAKYREGIREERLVLVSTYAPHAGFSVGNAMGRNKLIYALGDAALVVNAALLTGGTWAGAEEELKRERRRPVFVRLAKTRLEGNEALLDLGARAFLNTFSDGDIHRAIFASSEVPLATMTIADAPAREAALGAAKQKINTATTSYDDILPLLLDLLSAPRTAMDLAKTLDVQPAQMNRWLDRAIREGQVVKNGRPAKFMRATNGAKQPSLFES